MFPVAVEATKVVFHRGQWLHMNLVWSPFFMICFQTWDLPGGKYQSSRPRSWASPPLSSCINRSRVICVSWFKVINKKGTFRVASNPYRIYSSESFNMITTSQFCALVRGAATCFQLNCGQHKLSSPEGKDCTWPWSSPYSSWNASKPRSVHAESTNRLDRDHEHRRSHPASIDPGWYLYHDLK